MRDIVECRIPLDPDDRKVKVRDGYFLSRVSLLDLAYCFTELWKLDRFENEPPDLKYRIEKVTRAGDWRKAERHFQAVYDWLKHYQHGGLHFIGASLGDDRWQDEHWPGEAKMSNNQHDMLAIIDWIEKGAATEGGPKKETHRTGPPKHYKRRAKDLQEYRDFEQVRNGEGLSTTVADFARHRGVVEDTMRRRINLARREEAAKNEARTKSGI